MPKDTKTLGNNKARAWESLGLEHKKRGCAYFDTSSFLGRNIKILVDDKIQHIKRRKLLQARRDCN